MTLRKKITVLFIILGSIFLIIYFIFFRKHTILPSNCFNLDDREVVVLSNNKIDVDTILKGPSSNFFQQIQRKIKFKKAYISQTKSKILIEFNFNDLTDRIENVINKYGYKFKKKNGEYILNNNWKFRFNNSNILFYKGRDSFNKTSLNFNSFRGDFAIINFVDKSFFVYKLKNKNLVKISNNHFGYNFINKNDFKTYSNFLPIGIENYIFYQKKYAEKNFVIENGSSFFKIIENGFCVFHYNGNEYLIADKNNKIDPYLILDEENGINEIVPGLRKKYQNIYLTSETNKLNQFFYLEVFNDKLLFSESKEDFEDVNRLIVENKTLNNSIKDFDYVFSDQPKEVIFREVNSDYKQAIISKEKRIIDYFSIKKGKAKVKLQKVEKISFAKDILLSKDFLYVFTKDEIIKLKNDNEIERVKFKGELIGSPELISDHFNENIFFTTSEKLYFLDQDFNSIEGFPIVLKNKPLLPFTYCDNNQDYIIGFSDKKILSICDAKGNIKEKLNLDLENIKRSISIFENDGLHGVLYDNKSAYFINLIDKKIVNKIDLKVQNTVFLTLNEDQAFFYVENNKLIRNGFDGELKTCAIGNKLSSLKTFPKSKVVGVLSDKNLALFDVDGNCKTKFKLPVSENIDYSVLHNYNGQDYIIIIDSLSNLLYIYNFEGKNLLKSPLKGSKVLFVNKVGVDLQIYTIFNDRLQRYLI